MPFLAPWKQKAKIRAVSYVNVLLEETENALVKGKNPKSLIITTVFKNNLKAM